MCWSSLRRIDGRSRRPGSRDSDTRIAAEWILRQPDKDRPLDNRGGRDAPLLLGHTKLESTVRYLGIEVEDALEMAEQTEV